LTAVWEATNATHLVCANHYRTPEFKDSELNRRFLEMDTSQPRFDRMSELLERAEGRIDPAGAVDMLRDRKLAGGRFAGNGHRSTLNPLIATHSVVMDLTAGLFWAASPPHQLGRFVAFDANDFETAQPGKSFAEDPLLASGEYRRYQSALRKLEEGWRALKTGRCADAQACAEQAEQDNPGFYRNAWLLAESLQGQGRTLEAAAAAQRARAGRPALAGERAALEPWAQPADANPAQPHSRENR